MPSYIWLFSGVPQAIHLLYRRLQNIANYYIIIQHKEKKDYNGYVQFKSNPRASSLASIDQQLHWEKTTMREKENIYYNIKHDDYQLIKEYGNEQFKKDQRRKAFGPCYADSDYHAFLASYIHHITLKPERLYHDCKLRYDNQKITATPYQLTIMKNKKKLTNSPQNTPLPCDNEPQSGDFNKLGSIS